MEKQATSGAALLTVGEAAQRLSVSRQTVQRMADAGEIRRVRLGPGQRLVRYVAADVDALIPPSHPETKDAS